MALPQILAGVATGIGALGSIFGSGSKREIPPELQQVYDMVLKQAQEGLSDEAVNAMIGRAKTGLGREAGALGALTESRLTRAGAGTGVQQAALNRINKQRLLGIGEATTSAMLADERAKQRGLQQLGQLAPLFGEFTTETGQGFADLFSSGLGFLLNRPQTEGIEQLGQGRRATQQGIDEFVDEQQVQAGRPNVRPNPFQLQFP